MTFRRRIALLAGLSFVAAVLACSVIGFATVRRQLLDQIDTDLRTRVAEEPLLQSELADRRQRGPMGRPRAVERAMLLARPTDVLMQTVDRRGNVFTPVRQDGVIPVTQSDVDVATGPHTAEPVLQTRDVDGVRFRVITAPLPDGDAVMVARPLTEVDETLARFAWSLVIVSITGSVLAAGVGWWVARRSARPVEELTLAAEHVADTLEFDVGLTPKHDDEIGRLTTSIASMLGALQSSRDQQHRLVMDASHEFRTPLTSLRMNVAMLDHPDLDPGARAEVVADIRAELEELSNLSAELVDLATDAQQAEEPAVVDLTVIARRVGERTARRTGQTVDVSGEPWLVWGRPSQLERAVQNLVDNAGKWNRSPQPIEVRVGDDALVVRDHGPGIDPAERELVFERFYRSDAARATPGSGLGLAIVRQIVTAHGGTVSAGGPPEGTGAVLTLSLPPLSAAHPGAPPADPPPAPAAPAAPSAPSI
jgi:two-component system sensor histidine kinase MprB